MRHRAAQNPQAAQTGDEDREPERMVVAAVLRLHAGTNDITTWSPGATSIPVTSIIVRSIETVPTTGIGMNGNNR